VIRATEEEKQYQIEMLNELQNGNIELSKTGIEKVQDAAVNNRNMFEELMETCKYASLGQITNALFEVGGQYRRNM
jgi:methylmalonyl-CoA mutase